MPEIATAPTTQPAGAPPVTHIPSEAPRAAPAAPAAPAEGDKAAQTPAPEAGATPAGEKPAPTPEQAAKRGQSRFERRLDKAYRERAEAQAKAELYEKQLAELKPAPAKGEPTLADFDYDPEKYATAKAEFAKTQAGKELEAKQRAEFQKSEHDRLVSGWEEKVSRADGKYDDFDEVVGDLKPTVPFVAALMEAENGEDIAYHLGKNPKEAERIAKLPPLSQVREIGKLEAKLLAESPKPKTPSQAPAPITPLTGVAAAPATGPSDDDDLKTWIRKRQIQVHGKRR